MLTTGVACARGDVFWGPILGFNSPLKSRACLPFGPLPLTHRLRWGPIPLRAPPGPLAKDLVRTPDLCLCQGPSPLPPRARGLLGAASPALRPLTTPRSLATIMAPSLSGPPPAPSPPTPLVPPRPFAPSPRAVPRHTRRIRSRVLLALAGASAEGAALRSMPVVAPTPACPRPPRRRPRILPLNARGALSLSWSNQRVDFGGSARTRGGQWAHRAPCSR